MNFWRVSVSAVALACLVWAGLTVPVQANQDKEVKFELKCFNPVKKDDKYTSFYQKLETRTTQEMQVEKGNQPAMKQEQKQTFIIKWTPIEKKDNNFVVEQQIDAVQMNIAIGTTTISYDSTSTSQPKNPMTEFFESLMKVKLTVYINETSLKVTKVEGNKEFVDKLGESHPQMKNLLKSILSDKAIEKMAEQTWAAIPTAAKKKGDTWTGESELSLGPIGTYKNNYTYKYDGSDNGMEKITVTPSMTYTAPKERKGKEDSLPFEIKGDSKLTSDKDSSGTVLFDPVKGRIASSTMKMKVTGLVVVDIGGTDTRVELKQEQESKLTTGDSKEELLKTSAK